MQLCVHAHACVWFLSMIVENTCMFVCSKASSQKVNTSKYIENYSELNQTASNMAQHPLGLRSTNYQHKGLKPNPSVIQGSKYSFDDDFFSTLAIINKKRLVSSCTRFLFSPHPQKNNVTVFHVNQRGDCLFKEINMIKRERILPFIQ